METKKLTEKNKYCSGSCPVIATLDVLGGKWKPAILWELQNEEVLRFGKLKKKLMSITQKMLTQQLRELEKDEIIERKVYAEIPPRVEYRLSAYGKTLAPVLNEMAKWGFRHVDRALQDG
ncbi:MAG: helix-turn-helix domain-containing protein [Bacteroidota bacterium]